VAAGESVCGVGIIIYRAGNVLLRGIWRCVGNVAVGVAVGVAISVSKANYPIGHSLVAHGDLGHNAGHVPRAL
jgi:hypothetical protein